MNSLKVSSLCILLSLASACTTHPIRLESEAINEWSDPDAGPNQLGESCGVLYQVSLQRNPAVNYAMILVNNTNKEQIKFNPKEGKLTFENGKTRIPSGYSIETALDGGAKGWFPVVFPEKSDFIGKKVVSIDVPFKVSSRSESCMITAKFTKDPKKPDEQSTISDRSNMLIDFSVGSGILKTGGMSKIAGNSLAVGMSFEAYANHHGFFFDVTYELGRNVTSTTVTPPTGVAAGTPLKVNSGFIAMGYSYRAYINNRWTANFDFGPGLAISDFGTNLTSGQDTETNVSFALVQRASVYYLFPRNEAGQFGLGLTLYNYYKTAGKVGGESFSGDSAGLMANIKLGF